MLACSIRIEGDVESYPQAMVVAVSVIYVLESVLRGFSVRLFNHISNTYDIIR